MSEAQHLKSIGEDVSYRGERVFLFFRQAGRQTVFSSTQSLSLTSLQGTLEKLACIRSEQVKLCSSEQMNIV